MTLDLYKDSEDLSAEVLNRPIVQLEALVASLQQQVTAFVSGSRTVTTSPYDTTSDSPVIPGCIAYIGNDGLARKAAALWNASPTAQGVIMPADSAYSAGLVLAVNTGAGTCDIMTRGSIPYNFTPSLATNLFKDGTAPYTGAWNLSQTDSGKVERDSSGLYLKIPVVRVDALGNVYYTGAQPAAGYHIHKVFTIPADATWTPDTLGESWSYEGEAVAELDYFNWQDFTASLDGVEDYAGVISLSEGDNGVVVTSAEDPTGKVVRIWTALPDSHEQPVVRGIRTVGTSRLSVSSNNGLVTIGIDGWSGEEPTPMYRDRAVGALTDNGGYTMTHNVSGLAGDETVQLVKGSNGVWSISCVNLKYVEPAITSLDNATTTVSGGVLYYIFPGSRASGVTGLVRIPAPPEGFHWTLHPFVQAASGTVAVAASFKWAARPEDNEADEAAESLTPSTISLTAAAGTGRYLAVAETGWDVDAGGDGWIRLSADGSSAEDMNMISFGVKLESVENE